MSPYCSWTLGWHHRSSMEACFVISVVLFDWGRTHHWLQLYLLWQSLPTETPEGFCGLKHFKRSSSTNVKNERQSPLILRISYGTTLKTTFNILWPCGTGVEKSFKVYRWELKDNAISRQGPTPTCVSGYYFSASVTAWPTTPYFINQSNYSLLIFFLTKLCLMHRHLFWLCWKKQHNQRQ